MAYRPHLDGFRAVAMLLVLAHHCLVPGFGAGYLGVDLFFVLSGFLITSLLLDEHARTGGMAVGRFYWRRALRLYPALLPMLLAYVVVAPLLWPGYPHFRDAVWSALYLTDYSPLWGHRAHYVAHTWSLAVEAQFYLLLPVVVLFAVRRFTPWQVARGLAVATLVALAWRTASGKLDLVSYSYFRFDSNLSGLLAGCTLAALQWAVPARIRVSDRSAAWAGAAAVSVAVLGGSGLFGTASVTGLLVLAEFGALGIIVGARALPLGHPWLVMLGKLSYGMYLWHLPLVVWLRDAYPWWVTLPVGFAGSFAAAWVSYYSVEAAARAWRRRAAVAVDVPGGAVEASPVARFG